MSLVLTLIFIGALIAVGALAFGIYKIHQKAERLNQQAERELRQNNTSRTTHRSRRHKPIGPARPHGPAPSGIDNTATMAGAAAATTAAAGAATMGGGAGGCAGGGAAGC